MFERLDQIEARYEELTSALASPDIMNDSSKYQKTAKAHAEISEVVEKYREFGTCERASRKVAPCSLRKIRDARLCQEGVGLTRGARKQVEGFEGVIAAQIGLAADIILEIRRYQWR
jgi:protein subunit release factor A